MRVSLTPLAVALAVAGLAGLPDPVAGARSPQEAPRVPRIEVQAPTEMAPQVRRLERFDTARLAAVMKIVGLQDPGPPIPVFLAPEDGPVARQTASWVAGFAHGGAVVLFPARAPSYPHDTLEDVLHHEVAHVLIDRAAGGGAVPRWFHEGVALAAERTWSLGDRTHFTVDVAFGGTVPAAAIDPLFERGPGGVGRAYRLSGLLVQDLLRVHGPDLPARVLAGMRDGPTFDAAFAASAGMSAEEAVRMFWYRRRLWVTWLPWLTGPGVLWALVTLLALTAFWVARRRRAARRWEEEELD